LERKFQDFAGWLAKTPIPKYPSQDDLLTPRAAHADSSLQPYLGGETLLQYLGRVRAALMHRFPSHPFGNDPAGWADMRSDFQTEVKRWQIGSSDGFGGTNTRCLYKQNSKDPKLYEFGRDAVFNDWVSKCDLTCVLRSLMKKARRGTTTDGPLQRRCWLVLTYHAMGRGGEVKFQNYADWVFDPRFQITDIHWKEMKKLATYAMPMMADLDGYECCFYHALGSFWLAESGLYRQSIESASAQFVFPDLHGIKDASVAKKLTQTIRDNLPIGVPQPIKDSITVKSLRKASITTLAAHSEISLFDSAGRSGHSTGTVQDSYIDRNCIALGLRGGRVLAGSSIFCKDVKPPRMEWLGPQASPHVVRFMKALFVVSLDDFFPDGALYGILGIVTASLVMHHKKLCQDFSGNQYIIVDIMVKAAQEANIVDTRCSTPTDPAGVLEYWSDVLGTVFNEENMPQPLDPSVATLLGVIQEQQALTRSVLAKCDKMEAELASLRRGQQSQGQALDHVQLYVSSNLRTPPRKKSKQMMPERQVLTLPIEHHSTSGSMQVYPDSPLALNVEEEQPQFLSPPPSPLNNTSPQPPPPPPPEAHLPCMLEVVAQPKGSQPGFGSVQPFNASAMEVMASSTKGVSVQKLLIDMFQAGSFAGITSESKMKDQAIPLYFKPEAAKCRSVFELLDLVITPEDKVILANKDTVELTLKHLCKDLEDRAMQKMLVLEKGVGADIKYSKAKPQVCGLGLRVFTYKKAHNLSSLGQMPGPPPGMQSVRAFFAPRSTTP
jgi:hypothetical protein